MAKESLKRIENRIQSLTRRLTEVGDMRPGTLTIQYRDPEQQKKPFNQISYTHQGKSRSEYVRAQNLETAAYKTFKTIVNEIIDLSIKASRIRSSPRAQEV